MYKKAFTHGGLFHADDVFATALLMIINPDIIIHRGFQVPENFDGIAYDIGFGEYDHHQANKRVRENGIPYASFGLLWEKFGSSLVGEEEALRFDEEFVQPLDLADNTGKEYILSQLIADRNTTWKDTDVDNEKRFFEAVDFAKEILKYRLSQILSEKEAYLIVTKWAKNMKDKILYLEYPLPWKQAVKELECLFVIYPSNRGGYNVQAVPMGEDKGELRLAFPKNWRGKNAEELQNITGIKELTFCHASGFLCAVETKEQAYEVARLAISMNER